MNFCTLILKHNGITKALFHEGVSILKITYVTIGYCINHSEIVYAGDNKETAMNTNLYPDFHSFNVDEWENGMRCRTNFKNKMIDDSYYDTEDSHFKWEHFELE